MSTTCRTCGAEIFWALTPNDNEIPINAAPTPGGLLVLRVQAGDEGEEAADLPMLAMHVSTLARMGMPPGADEPRFSTHFATCKQAALHRRKK